MEGLGWPGQQSAEAQAHVWELGPSRKCGGHEPRSGWTSRGESPVSPACPSAHSYRTLATEHEALMQKYLHLLQIVETEKTVAKQLRQQIEDGEIEIERLKAEVTLQPQAPWVGAGTAPSPCYASLRPSTRDAGRVGRSCGQMGFRPHLCPLDEIPQAPWASLCPGFVNPTLKAVGTE